MKTEKYDKYFCHSVTFSLIFGPFSYYWMSAFHPLIKKKIIEVPNEFSHIGRALKWVIAYDRGDFVTVNFHKRSSFNIWLIMKLPYLMSNRILNSIYWPVFIKLQIHKLFDGIFIRWKCLIFFFKVYFLKLF